MNSIRYPERALWPGLLRRPAMDFSSLENRVMEIIRDVATRGDDALLALTKQYDGIELDSIEVPAAEIDQSAGRTGQSLKAAIDTAHRNITAFHNQQKQFPEAILTETGVRCWQKPVPIQKVGLYIPGGSAPLLSTVLMLGIPARLAGCQEVILCTPPDKEGRVDPSILYLVRLLGIDRIFRVGGAQAIAAMAHGTETIPAVDKIFGPGNQYVTMAKQIVSRDTVAIDMPAGPSELVVVADDTSNPAFIASDLLSQAEHGPDSQVMLITDSENLIGRVSEAIRLQVARLPRKKIAEESLKNSRMILLKDQQEIIDMVNQYAPEHLIIMTGNYGALSDQVINAGSVFLGPYTPESAGDYASGTNHTLPTGGWARSHSGVNMDSFYKKITFQEISKEGLGKIGDAVMTLAEAENLQAHSNAVSIRLKSPGNG